MVIMLVASKPLTRFVNAHPTVVVLCLGFLLMIGFSLVAEAVGFAVPKGYLYAAIGFSVLIEFFNQVASRNLLKIDATRPMRERTAEAIIGLLGGRRRAVEQEEDEPANPQSPEPAPVFGVAERNMVSGVLTLGERTVRSVMTPRNDISWVDLNDDPATIRQLLVDTPHSFFPVCRGNLDDVVGVGRAKDLVDELATLGKVRQASLREPIIVHESLGILKLMDILRRSRGQLVLVTDEFGAIEGLVTPIDVFEAIAGEFPDEDETPAIITDGDNRWKVDGAADLHHLEQVLETDGLVDDDADYSTLAGYLLARFGQLPQAGDVLEQNGIRFEVMQVTDRRIASVLVDKMPSVRPEGDEPQAE
jgi:CBS domain containing-hemolysin-like protein